MIADVRIASLDYLRGGAALAVALSHFFVYQAVAGEIFEAISAVSVEVFFVLSGYVLAPQVLLVAMRKEAAILQIFLMRRWMRTVPPYALALVVISLIVSELGSADFYRYLFYVQNVVHQSNQSDYFTVAWSLSVEEWFYILFPTFLLGFGVLFRQFKYSIALGAALAFIAIVAVLRWTFGDLGNWGASVRRVMIFRVDSIACGFALYLVSREWRHTRPAQTSFKLALATAGAAVLAVWTTLQAGRGSDVAKQIFPFIAMAFGICAILFAVYVNRWIVGDSRIAWAGTTLGRLSYSIYLFHTIFLMILGPTINANHLLVQLVIYLAILGSFSAGFFYTFELPILRSRPQYPAGNDPIIAL